MAGHLLFNSGWNESSLAPQFKWLDNTFKALLEKCFRSTFRVEYAQEKVFNWLTIVKQPYTPESCTS